MKDSRQSSTACKASEEPSRANEAVDSLLPFYKPYFLTYQFTKLVYQDTTIMNDDIIAAQGVGLTSQRCISHQKTYLCRLTGLSYSKVRYRLLTWVIASSLRRLLPRDQSLVCSVLRSTGPIYTRQRRRRGR